MEDRTGNLTAMVKDTCGKRDGAAEDAAEAPGPEKAAVNETDKAMSGTENDSPPRLT